jgi:hypothetical protein
MRFCLAALCLVVAVGAAVFSWGPLHNLFEDYKDSPDWVYLMLGVPFVLLSAAFLVTAVWLVWPRSDNQRHL